ncbi:hypothetical protein J6P92_07135 [bacterium]|nr:hypothetical protein [bacterium]
MNSEAAISQEFEEILKLIRDNKIKTYTLKFEPDPGDDNFVKHVPEKFYVSKINTTLIATYTDFENFLRDLYKHEHFLDISSIEIKPYSKNKRILLIDLQLKLYAQRDPGVATDFRSAPAQVQENKESSDNKPEDKSNSSDNNAKG